ncbi:MAG TPA: response regulator transcription factor [Acidimicrobiia bacterium]|nr:response regulator transcription factor [Acidimicrobiia bacterium]
MNGPSVLVVDDAPLFREGLAAALKDQGFQVVATASDALSAIAEARKHKPRLVVLDVLMPGISGLEVVDKIVDASPGSRVVLLTSSESEEDLLTAIKAGAAGYIVKDTSFQKLVAAMQDVVNGGAVVSPAMGGKLFETVAHLLRTRDLNATRRPALTGREVEILQWIADGRTSKEIGEQLFISENTVKNHVRNILDKLGLRSRHDAVRYAERAGLVQRR